MRGRYLSWRWRALALAAVTGTATGALVGLWPPPGIGSAAGMSIAGGLAALVVGVATTVRPRTTRGAANRVPGPRGAVRTGSAIVQPRRVRDCADPIALGVHPTAAQHPAAAQHPTSAQSTADDGRVPPYVARDADEQLRAALRESGLVLLLGEALAGKSRMAFEAMRATLADHVLICPVDAAALARIAPTVARHRRCVVWLDSVERFLDAGGLTPDLLDELLGDGSGHVVVLATARRAAPVRCLRARQSGSNQAARELWRRTPPIVERARQIVIERRWSPAEIARAQEFATDPGFARALERADRFGVAESVAGGPELLSTVRKAWTADANPRGAALVTAAVDCRRAGWSGPVPSDLLREIHETYLAEFDGRRLESFEAAVRFATGRGSGPAGLLTAAGTAGFVAHDYLVDALPRRPIPDPTRQALIGQATGRQAYDLGVAALDASRFDHARAAFVRAADSAVDGDVADARRALAVAVGESGRPDEAVAMLRDVHAEARRRLGPDHPDVLAIEHDLAYWRGETGDVAGAVAALGKLQTRCGRLFGPDHPRTLAVRHDLACWRGDAGKAAGTVAALVRLRNRAQRLLGPDHAQTLAIRHDLACWRGEAGNTAAAVAELTELLADARRTLGGDHPDVFAMRHDLACWRGRTGDATGAVGELEALLADVEPRFGADHARVLAIRRDLAAWRGEAGDPAGAVSALDELLIDLVRILGPDHPGALATRHDLALMLGRAGEAARAVRALGELLPDVQRVFGPNHPHTLTTRHNLAAARGEAGNVAGAVAALRELYDDRLRLLGSDHPATLATSHNLAAWRAGTDDAPDTVAALRQLLSEQVRVLGPNHPHTLTTRHNLAARGDNGDVAGTVAALEDLLVDVARAFGPDHPRTLAVRHDLACWRGKAGDVVGAIDALEELLAGQQQVLGPEHAHTLTTRHNLAHLRGESGDVAGAVAALEKLLADQVRLLGPEHPGTVATRHSLARLRRGRRIPRLLDRVLHAVR